MASNDSSIPEQLLQNLKEVASQMKEPGRDATEIRETTELAEQYVALFSRYSELLEKAQQETEKSLSDRKADLDMRENVLYEFQESIGKERTALASETTLQKLGVDVGKIKARDSEFKTELLSLNETLVGEIAKTVTEVKESEGRLAAALTKCDESLAKKVDHTLAAVSSCQNTVREHSKEIIESVSSCQLAVSERVSSCEKAFGKKLDDASQSWSTDLAGVRKRVDTVMSSEGPLMKSIKGYDGQVKEMGKLLASHMDEMSTSLRATHQDGMEKLGQEGADTRAHVDSVFSRSKEAVDEVKTALTGSADELSAALGSVRQELAQGMEKDRLGSIFENSARAGEILERLGDVQQAIEKPDTSVFEAVSELKDMLQSLTSTSGHVESLARSLEGAQKEATAAKTDLKTCQDERDQLASEVERLNSDMEQLKTKLPATPRRSERDSGSDDSEFSPGSGFEQEMAKAAEEAEQPSGPTVGDLQQRIQQLEEELRLSKESRAEVAENSVSKNYLDDALARMTETLSLRDRNEVQVAREEQAQKVAALEKRVEESDKRADEAEKESSALQSRVTELKDQVAFLENEREAAAPGENEPMSRKRPRLQQGSSNSSENPDETLFSSTCSVIHEGMGRLIVKQQDRPDLAVSQIVLEMTRVLIFGDQEERLMEFVSSGETEDWVCLGSVVVSDEQPSRNCCCHRLQGGTVNKCLCLRVLDRATMSVEFGLVDFESQG